MSFTCVTCVTCVIWEPEEGVYYYIVIPYVMIYVSVFSGLCPRSEETGVRRQESGPILSKGYFEQKTKLENRNCASKLARASIKNKIRKSHENGDE
jgi:hypothetical protein